MLLTVAIVVFVVAATWRGWRRGLTREVVDVVGIVATVALTAAVAPWVGRAIAAVTPLPTSGATVLAASALVAAGLGGLLLFERHLPGWLGHLPDPGRRVDRVGGGAFTVVWSLVLVTGILVVALSVPGSRIAASGPVCTAPLARALVSPASPLARAGHRLAALLGPAVAAVDRSVVVPAGAAPDAPGAGPGPRPVGPAAACTPDTIAAPAGGGPVRFPAAVPEAVAADRDAAEELLVRLNVARSAHGLAPLVADPQLAAVGATHATDLYLRGYVGHETLECADAPDDARCLDPFDRLRRAGVAYLVAGENLALAASSEAAHAGLMGSPTHRANILGADFRRVGIAVLRGPAGLLVVQEFVG